MEGKFQKAVFASGCFWCGEAIFEELNGVVSVVSGYATSLTGLEKPPTYGEVSTGKTDYAEAIEITFEPDKISYNDLLEIFWVTHDPTTKDKQGPDQGHQYRSAIFYLDENQKESAEESKIKLDESGEFDKPAVTEIMPFGKFFPAEQYHQDYYLHNQDAPYCQIVISPKLEKFRSRFRNRLKN